MLSSIIHRFGVNRGTIVASALTIVIALIMTSIAQSLTHQPDWTLGTTLAILCPLLIATPVYLNVFRMVDKLEQAERELTHLAQVDFLTNTWNRRYFTKLAESEIARCHELSQPLSLLLLDVDNFKIINDTYSHLVGDQVLIQIGELIRQIIRENDLLGRYGGDEFLLLLPNTSPPKACTLAERICTVVSNQQFASQDGPVRATVSIGVAAGYSCEDPVNLLLRKADQALYRAKKAGRNRVGFLIDSPKLTV